MPKKIEENIAVNTALLCEWKDCTFETSDVFEFTRHVHDHVVDVEVDKNENVFRCQWLMCGFESTSSHETVRHVNYHSFHTHIKLAGEVIMAGSNARSCKLSQNQRNIVPDLIEPFQCLWEDCDHKDDFSVAFNFYHHVSNHGDEFRGIKPPNILCKWKNCLSRFGTVAKLKEHLRSHSQERLVACPCCGALFASRTKFLDHCNRQASSGSRDLPHPNPFQCSLCKRSYVVERLLREHMRSHINRHQCPLCEMTCVTLSNLRLHMTYKHSDERNFGCKTCDFRGKTELDVTRHSRIHSPEISQFQCPSCPLKTNSSVSLAHHERTIHLLPGRSYCCHLCKLRFRRGNYLSKHLVFVHGLAIPSGYSRFRYRQDQTGVYYVQFVRYESLAIDEADSSDNEEAISIQNNTDPLSIEKDDDDDRIMDILSTEFNSFTSKTIGLS